MIYYRVKPEFDNVIVSKKFDILVANELYTVKELRKLEKMYANKGNYTKTEKELEGKARVKFYLMFEPVEISKRRIYWFFGARFEAKAGGLKNVYCWRVCSYLCNFLHGEGDKISFCGNG